MSWRCDSRQRAIQPPGIQLWPSMNILTMSEQQPAKTPTGPHGTLRARTPRTAHRTASQSPTRPQHLGDDLLSRLSPTTAVEALRSPTASNASSLSTSMNGPISVIITRIIYQSGSRRGQERDHRSIHGGEPRGNFISEARHMSEPRFQGNAKRKLSPTVTCLTISNWQL